MRLMFRKILSQLAYVDRLKQAVGKAYALADMIGVHGKPCCEHDCIYKSALKFMNENRDFENLAYGLHEWQHPWEVSEKHK